MSNHEEKNLKHIVECLLFTADGPLTLEHLADFLENHPFGRANINQVMEAVEALKLDYQDRSIHLIESPNGLQFQVQSKYVPCLKQFFPEKMERYSQALLETLALIAYRQPITRGEIEQVRGVSVSGKIIQTLLEREWIKVVGQKNVPGKPSLLGTTSKFLNDFQLKDLGQLPELSEIKNTDQLLEQAELQLNDSHA